MTSTVTSTVTPPATDVVPGGPGQHPTATRPDGQSVSRPAGVRSQLVALLSGTDPQDVSHRRTTFFVGSVVALLLVARNGAPAMVFALAFAAFGVCAALWVRGQYAEFLARRPGQRDARPRTYLVVLGIAAGLGVLYVGAAALDHQVSGLLLGAVMTAYFALGGLIACWRESGRAVARWGTGLALAAIGSVAGGYGVLVLGDTGNLKFGAALLLLGLIWCWPVAVSLLSEAGTRWFAGQQTGRPRAVLAVAGGVGFAATAGAIAAAGASVFAVVALLLLGVLLVAVASNTRADIVLVIAALALMGFTPGEATEPPSLHPTGGKPVLVALGDSYMSGEGASIYFAGTDTAGQDSCRRAPSAWAVQAGRQPPFAGTVFLACSGAVGANVRTGSYPEAGLPEPFAQTGEQGSQLAQYAERLDADHDGTPDFEPGLVVISLGGNDAGFSTIGVMCLVPGNCAEAEQRRWWTDGLGFVSSSLQHAFDEVRATFPRTPVVVTAYPDPIYRGPDEGERACQQIALRAQERRFVAYFLGRLNATVGAVAHAHGFYFLAEMQGSLRDAGLQLCDPANDGRPGLNFIGLRSVSGLAEKRFNPANWSHNSLHPNERGHLAMLQTFERWYADHTADGPLAAFAPDGVPAEPGTDVPAVASDGAVPVPSAQVRPAAATAPSGFEPVCSPLDPLPSGCRSRGTHWAAQQTAQALLSPRFLAMCLALLSLWAGVLAFFGGRQRRWQQRSPD